MGKIADALERHKKEKKGRTLEVETPYTRKPKMLVPDQREASIAEKFCALHECSPKVIALSAPDSLDAENFRLLRSQILLLGTHQKTRTIMVTSPFPGEGKTFVAANLAVSLAMGMDNSVLLVDCDLRFPKMHNLLGYSNSGGLHDFLVGKTPLRKLILRTQIERLSLLPAGSEPPNPAELLSSTLMEGFLTETKERHEDLFIILDSAPANGTSEAKILASYVDGIILVVMAGKTPRKAVEEAINTLGKDKLLGLVFNGYKKAYKKYQRYYKGYYNQ